VAWTSVAINACDSNIPILCLQTGPGDPLPPHWRSGALAFVTSEFRNGDLGAWPDSGGLTGIMAGDMVCQNLAALAGLSAHTSFRAWLSDGSTPATSHLTHNGVWTRLDGVPIASSLADLTDGRLAAALNVTENGVYTSDYDVWTGTTTAGSPDGDDCNGWTDGTSAFNGAFGRAFYSKGWWTDFVGPKTCSSNIHLYCLSNQVTRVLLDGFESGDTAAWGTTVP